jgi:hypothetical protein
MLSAQRTMLVIMVSCYLLAGCANKMPNNGIAPPPMPADGRVLLSEKVEGARMVDNSCQFHLDDRKRRKKTDVIFSAIIGRDGHVAYLKVTHADYAELAEASRQCVQNWTYQPYLVDGRPVEVETTITLHYSMNY